MKTSTPKRIAPSDVNTYRFNLYAMTFLLATPSHFANNVAPRGRNAIETWLETEAKVSDKNTRKACAEFAIQTLNDPVIANIMEALHAALKVRFGVGTPIQFYDKVSCPIQADTAVIMTALSNIPA